MTESTTTQSAVMPLIKRNGGGSVQQQQQQNSNNAKDNKDEQEKNIEELKKEVIMDEHKIIIEELVLRMKTNAESGLTNAQAKAVLERDGPNALTPPKKTPEWVKFCKQLFGGFALLLWIGAVLCFFAYSIQHTSTEDAPPDNVILID